MPGMSDMNGYSVKRISLTQPDKQFQEETECENIEDIISFCARVSNPSNQSNFNTSAKLLKYCVRKVHWSIFEMGDVTFEIKCTRDIGRQILRHRSFSFQEFSQRYASPNPDDFVIRECRFQDVTNRQSSVEVDPNNNQHLETEEWFRWAQLHHIDEALDHYEEAIERGIAKEQARVFLPEGNTPSVMYMKGSVRSWFHYCAVRKDMGTQKEHRYLANLIFDSLVEVLPFLNEIEVKEV